MTVLKQILYILYLISQLFIVAFNTKSIYAQQIYLPTQLEWVKNISNTQNQTVLKTAIDSKENLYTIGTFEGLLFFETINKKLNSKGGKDIYIGKYTKDGKIVSATSIGNEYDDLANDIFIGNDNQLYIAGYTEKKSTINGFEEIEKDMFWVRFDEQLKETKYIKTQSNADEELLNIVSDANNNVIVTGYFRNDINFDNTREDLYFATKGYSDVFFAKYDTSGKCMWVKTINLRVVKSVVFIELDNLDNIILAGEFISTCDFDPSNSQFFLSSVGFMSDIFMAKYTENGELISASRLGGTGNDKLFDIKLDTENNIHLCGSFSGFMDFDITEKQQNVRAKNEDIFLVSYQADNSIKHLNTFSLFFESSSPSIALKPDGSTILVGSFIGEVDFRNSISNFSKITSKGRSDGFVASFNKLGTFEYALAMGETEHEFFNAAIYVGNKLVISGEYEGNTIFTQNNQFFLENKGEKDAFIMLFNTEWKPVMTSNYNISGRINTNNETILCEVKLWQKIDNNQYQLIQTKLSDDGTFNFTNLSKSLYTIEAVPLNDFERKYQNTFYVNKATLETANWVELLGNARELDLQMLQKNNTRTATQNQCYAAIMNNELTIHNIDESDILYLKIFDTKGTMVVEKNELWMVKNNNQLQFSTSQLPNKLYWGILQQTNGNACRFPIIK